MKKKLLGPIVYYYTHLCDSCYAYMERSKPIWKCSECRDGMNRVKRYEKEKS